MFYFSFPCQSKLITVSSDTQSVCDWCRFVCFFSLLCVLIRRKPVGRQPLTLLLYEGTAIEGLIAPGALTAQQLLLLAISNLWTPPQL
jgi:hypothetical protein